MKLNAHDHTPSPKLSKPIVVIFVVGFSLIGGMVCLCGLLYAESFVSGTLIILISVLATALMIFPITDMVKAYVEVSEDEIHVVDYYFGIRKDKRIACSEITSAKIYIGYSRHVKGYKFSYSGIKYIVFKNDDKYLFKIMALPETEEIFSKYLK